MGKLKTRISHLCVRFNFHLLKILVEMIFKKFNTKNLFGGNASACGTFVLSGNKTLCGIIKRCSASCAFQTC